MSKQFTVYINWRNKEKGITNEVVLKDGGQPIAEITSYEDAWRLRDILNELHEENKALKKQLNSEHQMLDNAILLERTRMGQNSLKQYKEAIQ